MIVLSVVLALSGMLMLYAGTMIVLKRHWPAAADRVDAVGGLPWVVLGFALVFGFLWLFEWMTGASLRSKGDPDAGAGDAP